MDLASRTIDRHEPVIPDYIQGELTQKQEHLQTMIKNRFVLGHCNVGQIKRWIKTKPSPSSIEPKVITKELLDRAEAAIEQSMDSISDAFAFSMYDYLSDRGLDHDDINRFKICTTETLCENLSKDDISDLSLRISDKFSGQVPNHDIIGFSVPYYHNGVFYGFCTRILNHDFIKYSITIPHRMCFGIDYTRPREIYVVEGMFDAIQMIKHGYNCMALGDSQPNYWKLLTANKFDHVNLLFDNDYSGMIGACKAHIILEEMLKRPVDKISILIPQGKDPASSQNWNKTTLRDVAAQLTILGKEI